MRDVNIGTHLVGQGRPCFVVAEMSANHGGDFDRAVEIIHAMKAAGADAVKLQTYTADTLTIDSDQAHFRVGEGTLWEGRTLHDLYKEAYTPWEWHGPLQAIASDIGLEFFSTPFDETALVFLESLSTPVYKIASFEIVDLPLIERVASMKRPMIISTGMATFEEILEAVGAARSSGCESLILLKCTSAYPASFDEMDLRTIPDMAQAFGVPVGLSDHSLGVAVPIAAVALGACLIEKHFTLNRDTGGPDDAFSLEPQEFKDMVTAVRNAEAALGTVRYSVSERETASRAFRRSLFAVENIKAGEVMTVDNVKSIRPGNGLPPRRLPSVLGRVAARDIMRGTPMNDDLISDADKGEET
jgi:pseudaminic acid synthase